jgi:hypothetical protein
MNKQFRQGDVLLEQVSSLPEGLKKLDRKIVAYGEVTGHAHRFDCKLDTDAILYEDDKGNLWVKVAKITPLQHEEHATLTIEPGVYKYIPQREYSPKEIRRVQD